MDVSKWLQNEMAQMLRNRSKSFWNDDFFKEIVIPLLKIPEHGVILDLGCGFGALSFLVARFRPDIHIFGVDILFKPQEENLLMANKLEAKIQFIVGDANYIPFKDDYFDCVLCQTLFIHLENAMPALNEIRRVLKPNGIAMFAEYSRTGSWDTYQNSNHEYDNDDWQMDMFRLNRLGMRGRRASGHGDIRSGVLLPYRLLQCGFQIIDIRLNDRVSFLAPPYNTQMQTELLKDHIRSLDSDEFVTKNASNILAGGGSPQDISLLQQSLRKLHDKAQIEEMIEQQEYIFIDLSPIILIFSTKN